MPSITLPNEFFELAAEQLRSGVSVRLAVQGESMYPFLHSGDIINLVPYQGEDLPLYSAVFYCWEGQYMTHRLVGKEGSGESEVWIMLGDGNIYRYERVKRSQIIGALQSFQRPNCSLVTHCMSSQWINKGKWWVRLRPVRSFLIHLLRLFRY